MGFAINVTKNAVGMAGLGISIALIAGCSATTNTSEPQIVRMLTHESFALSDELFTELADQGIQLEILATGDAGSMTASAVLAAGAPVRQAKAYLRRIHPRNWPT
jgi:hypothetical protein